MNDLIPCPFDICRHHSTQNGCQIELSPGDWDALMKILNEPPEPNAELVEALKRYKEWVKQAVIEDREEKTDETH